MNEEYSTHNAVVEHIIKQNFRKYHICIFSRFLKSKGAERGSSLNTGMFFKVIYA